MEGKAVRWYLDASCRDSHGWSVLQLASWLSAGGQEMKQGLGADALRSSDPWVHPGILGQRNVSRAARQPR